MADEATTASTTTVDIGAIQVDQIFIVPKGGNDAFKLTDGSTLIPQKDTTVGASGEGYAYGSVNDQFYVTVQTPNVFSIVNQSLSRSPTGEVFVDIVIDCQDVLGATDYQVSVSLANS